MIQQKRYNNEVAEDMIKNENKQYKKISYEEIRNIVLGKIIVPLRKVQET